MKHIVQRHWLLTWIGLAGAVAATAPGVQLRRVPGPILLKSPVSEISLQRTWCYGLCPIDKLTLRSDGTAFYKGKANTPRIGHFRGRLKPESFRHLASRLRARGFFEMQDDYGYRNADLPDHLLSWTKNGQTKTVTNHAVKASALVKAMEAEVQRAASSIVWQPEPSGIRGMALWRPRAIAGSKRPKFRPWDAFLKVTPVGERDLADQEQSYSVRADKQGRFGIALRPGAYEITVPGYEHVNTPQSVMVRRGQYTSTEVRME